MERSMRRSNRLSLKRKGADGEKSKPILAVKKNSMVKHFNTDTKPLVHVEVSVKERLNLPVQGSKLKKILHNYLTSHSQSSVDSITDFSQCGELSRSVERVVISREETQAHSLTQARLVFHLYKLCNAGVHTSEVEGCDSEEKISCTSWTLPSTHLEGLWESLVFDTKVKGDLVRFVETALHLAARNVDSNLLAINRVILLHGPPGTGKTSLCRALAQKLAIRLGSTFSQARLIEINSHSLFSKWFSESGKLVQKMFEEITRIATDSSCLVCVLIDEVESLTSARSSFVAGSEPTDSIRVVNAVLTQIDALKRFSNVILLTTSNITGAIDLAFVDRADIKQYIGPPSRAAAYYIMYTAVRELIVKGVVGNDPSLVPLQQLERSKTPSGLHAASDQLWQAADLATGLSGRALRKLPFIALTGLESSYTDVVGLSPFLQALISAITKYHNDNNDLDRLEC